MTKHLLTLSLAAAGLLLLAQPGSAAAAARKLALLPMSGSNVHPGYLDAGRDILKDHLLASGQFQVLTLAGESGNVEIAADQAVAQGREVGAELVVVAHLTRLAGTGRVRLMAYKVADGSLAHADSIAIAGGPDDLDPALKRLAVGLATGRSAAQTADIESVTQKEADPLLKETATKIFGLRLGALVPLNRPRDLDAEAFPGIGLFWMYDARSFIGEVSVDLQTSDADSEGGGFSVGIGGYYPFKRTNFTPYTGAALAYSISNFGGAGGHGLRLTPAFGVLFGRLSTVQIRAELGYFINTFGERDNQTSRFLGPNEAPQDPGGKTYSHGPQVTVGLGF